jgi:hypothetical protein
VNNRQPHPRGCVLAFLRGKSERGDNSLLMPVEVLLLWA